MFFLGHNSRINFSASVIASINNNDCLHFYICYCIIGTQVLPSALETEAEMLSSNCLYCNTLCKCENRKEKENIHPCILLNLENC